MAELAMATGLARLNPTVLFQFLDDLPHLHEANLSRGCIKPIRPNGVAQCRDYLLGPSRPHDVPQCSSEAPRGVSPVVLVAAQQPARGGIRRLVGPIHLMPAEPGPTGCGNRARIGDVECPCADRSSQTPLGSQVPVLLGGTRSEVDVAGRGYSGGVQLGGVPTELHDVLNVAAVERLDDLERVETLVAHVYTLMTFFRARRAADTASPSFATRAGW